MNDYKFKIGELVTGVFRGQALYNKIGKIVSRKYDNGIIVYTLLDNKCVWFEEELKKFNREEADFDFTFKDVQKIIQEGETYLNIDLYSDLKSISKVNGKLKITISSNPSSREITLDDCKFELQERKHPYYICDVEHAEGGKVYRFKTSVGCLLGDIVVCDTIMGKSYGKVVNITKQYLTEKESKKYKSILKKL